VVEYFFTNCKSICPKMNTNMKAIYAAFKDEPDFMILSHTCDPQRDTVARMKVYADSIGADTKKWLFLTGRKDSLYNIARSAYLLDDPKTVWIRLKTSLSIPNFCIGRQGRQSAWTSV